MGLSLDRTRRCGFKAEWRRLLLTRDIHFGIMTELPLGLAIRRDHVDQKTVVAAGSLHGLVSRPPGVLIVNNNGCLCTRHYTVHATIGRCERARLGAAPAPGIVPPEDG